MEARLALGREIICQFFCDFPATFLLLSRYFPTTFLLRFHYFFCSFSSTPLRSGLLIFCYFSATFPLCFRYFSAIFPLLSCYFSSTFRCNSATFLLLFCYFSLFYCLFFWKISELVGGGFVIIRVRANRPGVAGAVLQLPPFLIAWLSPPFPTNL